MQILFFFSGKTVTFARTVDIPRSAYNFRFFASSILHHMTECTQMDHVNCMNYTVRTPIGVGNTDIAEAGWVLLHSLHIKYSLSSYQLD